MILGLSILALVLAAIPAAMFLKNLPLFCVDLAVPVGDPPAISVLIPARDEESGIERCVRSVLASESVDVEVLVIDDQSTDQTAAIVNRIAEEDSRVQCIAGSGLPDGWNGKQHACYRLSETAKHPYLVFLDADVRLAADALAKLVARKRSSNVALLSAFPHQETGTILEQWIIPMMHFILLGYLPFDRMRSSTDASFASGCGQLFLTSAEEYFAAGTHKAIMSSRHDGVKLPRAYRSHGMATDVVDGTTLAECRMYRSASEVIRGVLKNATEGIANPRLIVVFTVLLIGSSVLPLLMLISSVMLQQTTAAVISLIALVLGHLPRFLGAARFRQSWAGAIFHSLATGLFVSLQWIALVGHLFGKQVQWRGRQ